MPIRIGVPAATGAVVGVSADAVATMVQNALTPIQQQAAAAQAAAQAAQSTASAAQGVAATAQTTANAAQSTITNQLTPGFSTLSETAATVQTLSAASTADRAQLNSRTAALETLTATHTSQIAALAARASALEAKTWTVQRKTAATPAALIVGATVDLTVTWSPAMPDLNYIVSVVPDATGVLLSDIVAVRSKTTTNVVVTIKALVALTAGVQVIVEGARWG